MKRLLSSVFFLAVALLPRAAFGDLDQWLSRDSKTSENLRAITANGTLFVATGDNGAIVTSPDGTSWTLQTSGNTSKLSHVAWNGHQFAALAEDGGGNIVAALTSTDGAAWTTHSFPANYAIAGLSPAGNLFVAAGTTNNFDELHGSIITSLDGATWTVANSTTNQALNSSAWDGSKIVVISHPGGNTLVESSNGVAWTSTPTPSFNGYGMILAGGKFYAVDNNADIFQSSDALHWTDLSVGGGTFIGTMSLHATASEYIAVGGLLVESSSNGTSWSTRQFGLNKAIYAIGSLGDTVVVVGASGLIASAVADPPPPPPPTKAVITAQPRAASVKAGGTVKFTVKAVGKAVLKYQWKKGSLKLRDTKLITGTTKATLTLKKVQKNEAGKYTVVVSNSLGSVTSAPAKLTVR